MGSDADSVMLIVAGVLQELLDANYSVKIIDLEHTFLYSIRWDCEMTSEDKQKLINLMKKHMVNSNQKNNDDDDDD